MGPTRAHLAQLARTPAALLAALAGVAVFFAALLLGLATAGTREDLKSAAPETRQVPARALVVLGGAAPLPSAPPRRKPAARPRAARPAPPPRRVRARPRPARKTPARRSAPVPKLLSGTG